MIFSIYCKIFCKDTKIFLFSLLIFNLSNAQSLTLVHTSDTHSCVEPISPHDIKPQQADKGGFIRRVSLIKELRQEHPDMLLLDCGDFSQGSVYYNLFKGETEVELMNLMGYDACTIGNHEFDSGMDNMARLFRMANFPIVCTNYDFTGTPCEGLVKPWIVLKRKGVKIGVFALAPKLEGLVSTKNCVGVKYLNPAQVALETATMLKKEQKCDVVVCISHLGWNSNRGDDDPVVIPRSRYIDVVLGGHTHTYMDQMELVKDLDGKDVYVDQNGKHAIFVGKIVMNLK